MSRTCRHISEAVQLSPLPEGDLLDLAIRWEKVGVDEVVQLDAIEVRAAGHRSLVWTEVTGGS